MFDNFDDEHIEEFTEHEKEIIRRSSMLNTYKLLVSNYDFSIFPDSMFWLLTDYQESNVFDILLDYFESTEEYEICADLKKMQDNLDRVRASRDAKKNRVLRYLMGPKDELL